ncbi:MAG TPA: O-antigen ligase family protein [Planctomycetaceae bacterium]|nr:O-antigen ligase family protein [Planctomycetaceae bacterium]
MASPQSRRATRRQRDPEPVRGAAFPDDEGGLFALVKVLVAVLLAARLLIPPEAGAAAEGDTLWLVALWFVAGLVWAWDALRRDDRRLRLDLCDVAVWVVVAGHVLSALWTFHIGGDRRAALNLMWEWVALGMSFFLLRQVLRTAADGRRLLLATLCLAVALGGLGVWQHYVGLPQTRRQYEAVVSELDSLSRPAADLDAATASAHRQRRIELQQQLAAMNVPPDEQGRRRFEDRLYATEPFGLFALANTFATVLLAWLVVGAALAAWLWRRPDAPRPAAVLTLLLLPPAYCLLLTKSRTAWAGLAAAGVAWAWIGFRDRRSRAIAHAPLADSQATPAEVPARRSIWRVPAAAVILVLAALIFVATLGGGLDRQVVSEAPKSFRYRLEYWAGAAAVVREHPLLGVGPGNFRQHYLKHKLPESSEEIAEPHNFLLDLWTSGGLLAAAGGLLLIVIAGRTLRRVRLGTRGGETADGHPRGGPAAGQWLTDPLVFGTGLSCLAVVAGPVALGAQVDTRLLALFGGWVVLAVVTGAAVARRITPVPLAGLAAACVGVLVHLLGSGGIEMPAIPQLLLVLLALGTGPLSDEGSAKFRNGPLARVVALCAIAVLGAACLASAVWPVLTRHTLLAQGDAARDGDALRRPVTDPRRAAQLYQQAAQADPLSPEPLIRLADLALIGMIRTGGLDDGQYQQAVQFARLAIDADPHNPVAYRRLGDVHLTRFRQRQEPEAARLAADALTQALERYPASSLLQAQAAIALEAAGQLDAARRRAARALELDEISRRRGHQDKYLPDPLRMEVQRLAGLE